MNIQQFNKKNNVKIIDDYSGDDINNVNNYSNNDHCKNNYDSVIDNINDNKNKMDTGINHKFSSYVLWSHDISNRDWSIKGYKKMCLIDNISTFWKFMNNFEKLGHRSRHFFLMRNDTEPTWEHKNNRDGGVCTFKIELINAMEMWELLNIHMILGTLSKIEGDINGISFSPKNNWVIIKVWNRDSKNDLTVTLNQEILDKYSKCSIRYKANAPEY